ncbi:MAG TPA: LamG-like jellyroll fold domain-containing protein, partial [Verrucomicrobiae bacterium]
MNKISKLSASLALAAGFVSSALGQVQVAGTLHVNLDATGLPVGSISQLANAGAAGGVFQSFTNSGLEPRVVAIGGNGTHGVLFDGNCLLAHKDNSGNPQFAPANLTLSSFTGFSVEAWVYEATIPADNPVVSWGTRGNCNPNQVSCAYGSNGSYGGMAMWCNDHGWGTVPTAGFWHHLVWTLDNAGNENLYSDGVLKASYTGVTPNID